ncbi:MAG: PilZ domain-containing protein [Phycisphaeraceae bacterium]|nr:PilZ domain-containing protein [Phycisphaeraceae bacterium]
MTTAARALRPISVQDLSLGQHLHGSIYAADGRVLLPSGTVIDLPELAALRRHDLYVRPDWFKKAAKQPPTHEPDATPIIQALTQKYGPRDPQKSTDRRAHPRYPWNVTIHVDLEESTPNGPAHRRIEVTTLNISLGGVAFSHRQFIHLGTKVSMVFDTLPGQPAYKGLVRSCVPIGGMQHRIGVQFTTTVKQKKKPDPSTPA